MRDMCELRNTCVERECQRVGKIGIFVAQRGKLIVVLREYMVISYHIVLVVITSSSKQPRVSESF